jgi:sugar phosphate isomerase/epimerase
VVRQRAVECLRACLPQVQRLGLTASIPNLGELAAVYGELAVVTALLEAVGPPLTLTWDVGNWLMAGEDPLVALDRLAPRVAHVHLKDWRVEPDRGTPDQEGFLGLDGQRYCSVALGAGLVDLAGAIQRLARLGYAGHLAIEYEGTDDPAPHLRRGVAHARQLLAAMRAGA